MQHNFKRVHMPPDRPELHGRAERWIKTVMQTANSMLFASRLLYILWPSAVAHAKFYRNQLPLSGLGPYTPYERKKNSISAPESIICVYLALMPSNCFQLLLKYPAKQAERKRLLYVCESADRFGFRCFDPVICKFNTEFELIFNETSARK